MYKLIAIFLISVLLFSCEEEPKKTELVNWTKENSTKMGEEMAIREEIRIKIFLETHPEYKMEKTGSGLRIDVYSHSEKGDSIQTGDVVDIEYELKQLDGTLCYKTAADEVEEFVVDRSDIETGVQEGIKKLKTGDKARMIIPSHIAHGLLGDSDKIPPLTTLLLDLTVVGKANR